MRVALIIFGDLDQPSGGYLYDRHLVAALRRAGHEVSIVSQPTALSYRAQASLGRSIAEAERERDERADSPTRADAAPFSRLASLAPDLVIVDELNHAAVTPWIGVLREALPGVHISALVHHLRRDERTVAPVTTHRERRFLRACDSWLCNSATTLARVRRIARTRRSSAVAFPGSDSVGYGNSEAGGAAGGRVARPAGVALLSVGTVIPRKNYHVLIHAIHDIPGVSLTIVGDTSVDRSYARRLSAEIAQRSLSSRVRLRGRLPRDLLDAEYRGADLFVGPSRYEGFGIVYLEALSRGVPVIASREGGAVEIVRDGVDGELVAPGSVRQLRGAIRRYVEDEARRRDAGERARARAASFPSWERSMDGAAAFLETVTARRGE